MFTVTTKSRSTIRHNMPLPRLKESFEAVGDSKLRQEDDGRRHD
jgi:hypothetical protein